MIKLLCATLLFMSSTCYSLEPDVLKTDVKGSSSFTFFFHAPGCLRLESQKKKQLVLSELEKIGQVVYKENPLFDPFEGGDVMSEMLTAPSLSFEVTRVRDVKGDKLPLHKASLTVETCATIDQNEVFCSNILWTQSCFIQDDPVLPPDVAITRALSTLFTEFSEKQLKSNQAKPIFYTVRG